jgi:RNA polymerase sigma-70 factor (ECF subfamily)
MPTLTRSLSPAQAGTPACLADLASQYSAELVRLCASILDDAAEAQDAVQETLIAASRSLDTFRGDASWRTWLYSIAINTCREHLRRRRSRQALELALAAFQRLRGHTPGPEETVMVRERSQAIVSAIRQLDEKHRLPVILRYMHDLPVREIATLLQVNEGTLHSRLYYARRRLLELLDE